MKNFKVNLRLGLIFFVATILTACNSNQRTSVSIEGEDIYINGKITYPGQTWQGNRVEGLLMNARLVQGIFDDENPETRPLWNPPQGTWDPEQNLRAFIDAMPLWRQHGLLAFTLNLQGGSPEGYSKTQPWINSAFAPDGSFREAYFSRLGRILDAADALGMVVILGLFYFGQEPRLATDAAVVRAAESTVDWLIGRGDRHVLIEVANETNIHYRSPLFQTDGAVSLIRTLQERSQGRVHNQAGRFYVSTSYSGGVVPEPEVIEGSDFVLLHGNGVKTPEALTDLIRRTREVHTYRGQPIVINEDDHYGFDQSDCNLFSATREHVSWGFFDYRRKGEAFEEGYQSMPCDWGISSDRKRGFFQTLSRMTQDG
jgi:hypothetical protein